MPAYVALLRAVNVGGTGKLPMAELKSMCVAEGFVHVETYIASGNVVFASDRSAKSVKAALEQRLEAHMGKPVGVILRTAEDMVAILRANPFADAPANHTYVLFLDAPPLETTLDNLRGQADEEVKLGTRELYVRYPDGQGKSKLVIPAAKTGTARNMNTVAKLAAMAAKLKG